MTDIEYNDIELGNAVVDIHVHAADEDVAEKMAIDIRDRAFRVSQAMGTGVHPDEAESHPVAVMWEKVLEDRFGGDQDG